jgi:hypothetical protein
MHCWGLSTVLCCLMCTAGLAQQNESGALPDAPSASAPSQPETQRTNPLQSGTALFQILQEKSRVFPDLATQTGPFDSLQKFKLAANNSVAVSTIASALLGSGFSQAMNRPAGYHQGAEGYAKRFGADMARSASSNMFGTFLIASMLHEDPRFYVRRHLSFKQTLRYAAVRLAISRSDEGAPMIDYAGLVGSLAAEGLANTYYPQGNRGVGSTLVRYASDLGWRFAGNMTKQYWPQINRMLRLVPSDNTSTPAPAKP